MPANAHIETDATITETGTTSAAQVTDPWRRIVIGIAIVAFLVVQVAIPLSYYLRDEPTSERFSWRMFSSIDLSSWDTKVSAIVEQDGQLVEREVPIRALLQETHWKLVERAQLDIVEPLLRQLVAGANVREVRYVAQGYWPSGNPMTPIRMSIKPGQPVQRIRDE